MEVHSFRTSFFAFVGFVLCYASFHRFSRGDESATSQTQSANGLSIPHEPAEDVAGSDQRIAPEPASTHLALDELEQLALANHAAFREALARIDAARGNWLQVGLPPNPLLGYSGQQLGSRGQAEQNGVLIAQEIVRGGKLSLNRAVASHEIALAEQQAETVRRRVLTDVRLAFHEVLFAEQRIMLNEELVKVGEEALRAAQSLFETQTGSRLDVLQAKLEIEQARILLRQAINRQRAEWRMLSSIVGEDLSIRPVAGAVDREAPVLSWEESLGRLLAESPEVATAAINIDRARCVLQRACVEPKPNITVEGIVQHDAALDSSNGNLQVTFPVPILDRNQGAIREARAQLVAAQHALERVQTSLANRLSPAFERYANAKSQVDRYSVEIVPAAKSSMELTREGYRAGEFGFVNLLTAQRTFFQISLAYLEAQRELWIAIIEMDGLLLRGSLNEQ